VFPAAAALSILGMFVLCCPHPPATAVSSKVVLGHIGDYRFTFFPMMVDSVWLSLVGAIYSDLTGKP